MNFIQKENNLSSLIYKILVPRLKAQLDLPEIPNIYHLLDHFHRLSFQEISFFRDSISMNALIDQELLDEFMNLLDALTIYFALRLNPISIELLEKCYDCMHSLQNRIDFEVETTLNCLESSIISALNSIQDLELLRKWLPSIDKLNQLFKFDTCSLRNWFEVKLIENLIFQLQFNKENACMILKFIQEMLLENFNLTDIKSIAMDSAFYYISDLEERNEKSKISEALGIILDCGIVNSLELKFKKFAAIYPVLNVNNTKKVNTDHPSLTKNDLEFISVLYQRNIQTTTEFYKIEVQKAKISEKNELVAVKSYFTVSQEYLKKFEKEIEILKILSNKPGPFLKYYGSYMASKYDDDLEMNFYELGIIMEFCPKTLTNKISANQLTKKRFTEADLSSMISSLLDGFLIMEENKPKIYHQDIKPDNIYFSSNNRILIGDFNVSEVNILREATLATGMVGVQGTLPYMAPEIYAVVSQGRGKYRRGKADVYSFGITLLQMYTCDSCTYNDPTKRPLLDQKVSEISFPWLRSIVTDCVVGDYKQRSSFKDLLRYIPRQTIAE